MTSTPRTDSNSAGQPPPDISGLPPLPDYVDGPSTPALLGAVLEYRYTQGNHYRLSFDHEYRVTFEVLNHPDGPTPPHLSYRARVLRDDLIMVHWLVKPIGVHVCLSIDLAWRRVNVAAMMPPNRWEFFDTADIISVKWNSA